MQTIRKTESPQSSLSSIFLEERRPVLACPRIRSAQTQPPDRLPLPHRKVRRQQHQNDRPQRLNLVTPLFHYSTIPLFHNSTTPLLHSSNTPFLSLAQIF